MTVRMVRTALREGGREREGERGREREKRERTIEELRSEKDGDGTGIM
jgi:hypothetical protein